MAKPAAPGGGPVLEGKVAVVTGANSGIGYYTALRLAEMGCKVVITCRSVALVASTAERMQREFERRRHTTYTSRGIPTPIALDIVRGFALELDDFDSVREFATKYTALGLPCHFLVNNAGMMVKPLEFSRHNPELEMHTAVNFLGPVLLTHLLMPVLSASKGRIVNVASAAHQMPEPLAPKELVISPTFLLNALKEVNQGSKLATGCLATANAFGRYGVSKLCNVYHAHYIANRFPDVAVCSLHPGTVATGFARNLIPPKVKWVFDRMSLVALKTEEEGAETSIYCCLVGQSALKPIPHPQAPLLIAPYFCDCADRTKELLKPLGWNIGAAMRILEWSHQIIDAPPS